ncbi:MAG: 50S ribosomal protein L31, partial [Bryobacteraceae bacterium]
VDSSNGHKFVVGSTVQTDQMEMFEGKKYPVVHVSISSTSHPFFVGGKKIIDTEGRVDRFQKKYAKARELQAQKKAATDAKAAAKARL